MLVFFSTTEMIYTSIIQTTALALLLSAIKCQPPNEQASLDDLIKEIFTTGPTNENGPPNQSPPPPSQPENPPRGPDTYTPPNTYTPPSTYAPPNTYTPSSPPVEHPHPHESTPTHSETLETNVRFQIGPLRRDVVSIYFCLFCSRVPLVSACRIICAQMDRLSPMVRAFWM